MLKQFIMAAIVVLTTIAAASADLYVSTSGPGWYGNTGTIQVSGRGVHGGALITPHGIYAGANTRHGSASIGTYDGAVTGMTLRTRNVRADTFRTADGGYAGTVGLGSRIHAPSYYHGGAYYGGAYAPMPRIYASSTASSGSYVSTADYMRSRY